jgi:hypothetical protein
MSRKDDLINSYGGVNGILSQTPDAKARIRNELLEAARQDAIDANNQASKAAQGSLSNDLAGVGGQVAGVVGGSYLGNQIFNSGSSSTAQTGGQVGSQGAGQAANQSIGAGANSGSSAASSLPNAGPSPAAYPMASNPDGTILMSDGTSQAASAGNTFGELGGAGPVLGVVGQGVRIGKAGADAYQAGRGKGGVEGTKAGIKDGNGPLGWINKLEPFSAQAKALGGFLGGVFGSPTTTQTINSRWSDLANSGAITPEQLAAKQADLSRSAKDRSQDPISGKMWNLQTALDRVKAGGGASDEFGQVAGNYQTFGKDWNTYTPDQKRAITMANAQEGNFSSKKGDVLFADENKAKQIRDQIIGGTTSTKDLYAKYGLDYNKAMQGLQPQSNNGSPGMRPQSNNGSPGRRPQQSNSSNRDVKKKAKDSSNALSKLWK